MTLSRYFIFHGHCLLHDDFYWKMHCNTQIPEANFLFSLKTLWRMSSISCVLQFSWIELCSAHVEYSKATLKLSKFSSHWLTVRLIIQLTWMDYTSDLRITVKFPDWNLPRLKMYKIWFTQLFGDFAQNFNRKTI